MGLPEERPSCERDKCVLTNHRKQSVLRARSCSERMVANEANERMKSHHGKGFVPRKQRTLKGWSRIGASSMFM